MLRSMESGYNMKLKAIGICIILILVVGCFGEKIREVSLEEEFTLALNEKVKLVAEGSSITIELVSIADNRCIEEEGRNCFWQGEINPVLSINDKEYRFGSELMQWTTIEGTNYTIMYIEKYEATKATFVIKIIKEDM